MYTEFSRKFSLKLIPSDKKEENECEIKLYPNECGSEENVSELFRNHFQVEFHIHRSASSISFTGDNFLFK